MRSVKDVIDAVQPKTSPSNLSGHFLSINLIKLQIEKKIQNQKNM